MRVFVNGIPLLSPRTGVGNYVAKTMAAMQRLPDAPRLRFFYGWKLSSSVVPPMASFSPPRGWLRGASRYVLDAAAYACGRAMGFDLYHETNFIPKRFPTPTIVMVHDLSFLLHAETHPPQRVRDFHRYFFPRISWADRFLVHAESVKRELTRYLAIPADRIDAVPCGVDAAYRPLSPGERAGVMARHGLTDGGYLLYVGTIEPRKNLERLFEAYAALPAPLRKKHPLVLAGGVGWRMEGWQEQIRKLGVMEDVRWIGRVSDEDLPALYGGAAAFAFPSLYEGFGLPPLEAMACGTAVLTSDRSSLPEVVGEAGLLVDPESVPAITAGLRRLLEDPAERARLGALGRARAKNFTWERTARGTLDAYGRCLGGGSR